MKSLFLFLFTCIIATFNFSQPSFVKDSLDKYIQTAMQQWQIPGVAVCIVKDGKVEWMKGYGVKEWNRTEKIDENTLFGIGSNAKAFTATALAC
jgi:CubicO group peptidase (beta-lactamase class C family)